MFRIFMFSTIVLAILSINNIQIVYADKILRFPFKKTVHAGHLHGRWHHSHHASAYVQHDRRNTVDAVITNQVSLLIPNIQ